MRVQSVLYRITAAVLAVCCFGLTVPAVSAEEVSELPAHFDWREEAPEIISPVKKQVGNTCWAYATIACAEANLIKKGLAGSSIDLSETHLIWFTNGQTYPTDPDDLRYAGVHEPDSECYDHGASVVKAALSLAAWQGVIPESDAPPNAEQQPLDESMRYQSIAHLQNTESYPRNEPLTIKQKIMEKGPLFVTYFNSHEKEDAISEQHGFYNQDFAEKKEQDALDGGYHSVTLIGWDDSFSRENFFTEPPGDGAWIVRDSMAYHLNAGHDYLYISYYEASLQTFYSFDYEPVTNYGNVYHYNDAVVTRYNASKEENGYLIANVFEAKKAETVAAVGFYTVAPAEAYQISVYALEPGFGNPQDGELIEQFDGYAEFRGFHTVPLPQHYAVGPGQLYSVVIQLPTGKKNGTYYDSAVYGKGVSFRAIYNNEGLLKWSDCYDVGMGDVCIHVYTEYEGEPEAYIPGDLNRDGEVNAVDLSLLKQVILGSERADLCLSAADWNGDHGINTEDVQGLLSFLESSDT
ncbi:MAG: hypothetical protein K5705_10200 [Oscillospiraceae bacterium]|nr:hypothetical protein [Oscillospiraceae bacterium]